MDNALGDNSGETIACGRDMVSSVYLYRLEAATAARFGNLGDQETDRDPSPRNRPSRTFVFFVILRAFRDKGEGR